MHRRTLMLALALLACQTRAEATDLYFYNWLEEPIYVWMKPTNEPNWRVSQKEIPPRGWGLVHLLSNDPFDLCVRRWFENRQRYTDVLTGDIPFQRIAADSVNSGPQSRAIAPNQFMTCTRVDGDRFVGEVSECSGQCRWLVQADKGTLYVAVPLFATYSTTSAYVPDGPGPLEADPKRKPRIPKKGNN